MEKTVYVLILMICSRMCMGQNEQKMFWALNGVASAFTWDIISAGSNNNRIDNGSGIWNSGTKNWTFNNGITNLVWRPAATAIFGGNPGTGAAGTVTVTGTQLVRSLVFSPPASGAFTIGSTVGNGTITNLSGNITANASATINSTLAGSSGLTLSGTGTITLTSPSTYTGTTTINSGTLVLSNGTANVTTPTLSTPIVIAAGGTLTADIFNENHNLSGPISGAGTLSIINTASQGQTLRLYGNNSGFTGNFLLPANGRGIMWSDNQGTGNAANTGSAAAAWVMNGSTSGAFGFIETAGSATPSVQLGSLSGNSSATVLGAFGGSGVKTFQIGALNTSTTFAGNIQDNPQGTGTSTIALTKVGSGTLSLTGSNTYSGPTTVNAGTLAFTSLPSSTFWNIAVNAASTPNSTNSGLVSSPAPVILVNPTVTVNIVLTGTSTGFTWIAVSWSSALNLSVVALQLNGVPVTSGVANNGTTVTASTLNRQITVSR